MRAKVGGKKVPKSVWMTEVIVKLGVFFRSKAHFGLNKLGPNIFSLN